MQKKTKRHLRRSIRITLEALTTVAIAAGMLWTFAQAVLQESYKLDPPSQEEIQHDPSLEQYAAEETK